MNGVLEQENKEFSFSRLDRAFAHFFVQLSAVDDSEQQQCLKGLLMRLSAAQADGHSCIRVNDEEIRLIKASRLVGDNEPKALVLEEDRLYLQRYWFYEQRLAEQLHALAGIRYKYAELEKVLNRYFKGLPEDETDWQRQAALKAVGNALTIITGGPGTGKTTTVVRILAVLQELNNPPLQIALAAPTGKAAMRLEDSITANKQQLPCSESVKNTVPERVVTIHHLLGAQYMSPYFKHDADNPLPFDLVVVDEVSMVDLALMSKLVDALKPGSRLILLGDKEQLASVESGSVLADLTEALPDNTQALLKSYRFSGRIKELATAVNDRQPQAAWKLLEEGGEDSQVSLLREDCVDFIAGQYGEYLHLIKQGAELNEIFSAFNRFQVLCANRNGPLSVADINFRVEKKLQAQNLIHMGQAWYVGRPVMMTENNPAMKLYNGDVGLCLYDPGQQRLLVFFMRPDGSFKTVLPGRLTKCQTVYAMTIHKSQGSEYDEVLVVLPDKISPLLTRELLYTAITRAKSKVRIVVGEKLFKHAVRQEVARLSGLVAKLQVMKKTEM